MPRKSMNSANPQRTDLNTATKPLPVKTMPSTQYGQDAMLQNAQRVIPMAKPADTVPTPPQQVQQNQAAANQPPMPTAPPTGPPPGALTPLGAPSEQPNVPVTNGIATGAGAGPEALTGMPQQRVSQLIARVAQFSGNPDLAALAQHAQQNGQ